METPQVDDFLMMAATIIGAIAVITGGLLALYRFLTSSISKRLDGIDSQLKRNGGSSLRDAVDRIEERQGEMRDYVVRTADRLDEHIDWHLSQKEK
jgi:hypothetical protein